VYLIVSARSGRNSADLLPREVTKMKLVIRIIVLSIVVAGFAAASVTPKNPSHTRSLQSATARMPLPHCGEGFPCPPDEPDPE